MPAIRPAILKQQSALLANEFGQPQEYLHSLHHLLDQYANRAFRSGQSGKPKPLLQAYDVPQPVLRQLLQDLEPKARQDPASALILSQGLWDEAFLETRMLAAGLLGKIPADPDQILNQLENFLQTAGNERVISTLLDQGLVWLRQTDPEKIIERARTWLGSRSEFEQTLGLRVIQPLIAEPAYKNLPVFFKLLDPLTCEASAALRPDLVDVIEVLARRSPRETAYFLRENLGYSRCTTTAWLIRQVLPAFPEEIRNSLRERLRQVLR
jgi:hypothetical protein